MRAKNKPSTASTSKVKVLYQYMNGRWYAFADMGDEIFFGQVPLKAKVKTTGKPTVGKKTPSKDFEAV